MLLCTFAYSESRLKKNLQILRAVLESLNLSMNTYKTKEMAISNKGIDRKLKIGNDAIEQVTSYKYLGTTIDSKGKREDEFSKRIQWATTCYRKSFLCIKYITEKTKISIYKTIYVSVPT